MGWIWNSPLSSRPKSAWKLGLDGASAVKRKEISDFILYLFGVSGFFAVNLSGTANLPFASRTRRRVFIFGGWLRWNLTLVALMVAYVTPAYIEVGLFKKC